MCNWNAYCVEGEEGNLPWFRLLDSLLSGLSRVAAGDELERGERFGMITFGSRVDLYLPENLLPAGTKGVFNSLVLHATA